MAITRQLVEVRVNFASDGTPLVRASGIISDDVEGTVTGKDQIMAQAAVVNAAIVLRDAVMTVAANAGKPLTL